ncbi:MAG: GyrI-like domain-containing protein [Dehalococcoidia bacterium]|nr:GyrI-like domain-containing protein [Dehalococcoidia bacterium]
MADVTIVEVPAQMVVCIKRKGNLSGIPAAIVELVEYAMANSADIVGPPVALFHETSAEAMEKANREGTAIIDVSFPVSQTVVESDAVKNCELPGGTMARIVHKGPYDASEPAYIALFKWIADNGKVVIGPVREAYMNDPAEISPEEYVTEIYAPIA